MPRSTSFPRAVSHYRLLSKIGAGGMGEVFLAVDENLGRKVALKLLPPTSARSRLAVRRLMLEARAAAALDHPNICSVYEVGRDRRRMFIPAIRRGRNALGAHRARPLPRAGSWAWLSAHERWRAQARHRPPRREAGT